MNEKKINSLDLERLEADSNGIEEALTWGVEPVKALVSTLYDLNFGIFDPPPLERTHRTLCILAFMEEQLDRLEKYLERVRATLQNEKR